MRGGFDTSVLCQSAEMIWALCVDEHTTPSGCQHHLPLKKAVFGKVDCANAFYWDLPRKTKKSIKQKTTDLILYAESKATQYAPSLHSDTFVPFMEELLPVWTVFPHLDANYKGGLSPIVDAYEEAYIGFLVAYRQNSDFDAYIDNPKFKDYICHWGGRAGLIQKMDEFEQKYFRE